MGIKSPAICSIDELIERQVAVERADHPVAPRPHLAIVVDVVAVGVGVAGRVQPRHRHPLAVVRRLQERVDALLVRVRRPVGQEGVDLGRRGRQSGQVVGDAAQQRLLVRFGRRLQPLALEAGEDELIDRIARPSRAASSPADRGRLAGT